MIQTNRTSLLLMVAALSVAEPSRAAGFTTQSARAPQASPSPAARPINNGSIPAVSPDGRQVAYTSDRGGTVDVYIVGSEGGPERQVTHTAESEGTLAWNADATRILFSVFKNDRGSLYSISPEGDHLTEVASVPGRVPTPSADGRQLVYMAGSWTATILTVAAGDGSNPRAITDGSSVAWNSRWSPDGTRIAFTSRESPKSELAVYTMNADGSSRRQLTHLDASEGGAQLPAWSPDGKQIAVQANNRSRSDDSHLWVVDVETGAARKLAVHSDAYLDEAPCWFPDGKRLAFQSNRTGRMEVWTMNVDGSDARQLTGQRR